MRTTCCCPGGKSSWSVHKNKARNHLANNFYPQLPRSPTRISGLACIPHNLFNSVHSFNPEGYKTHDKILSRFYGNLNSSGNVLSLVFFLFCIIQHWIKRWYTNYCRPLEKARMTLLQFYLISKYSMCTRLKAREKTARRSIQNCVEGEFGLGAL